MKKKNILIIGLGLLGASLGMALRGSGMRRLGWSHRAATRQAALAADAIDATADQPEELLTQADLTVLALPIPAIMTFLEQYASCWRPGTVVTDVGSVKSDILNIARQALSGTGVHFIGSHPMAGTEKKGVACAFPELYENAEVFVVPPPGAAPEAVAEVKAFWTAIGTRVVEIGAAEHDDLVAHTSHVLHILASALALSVLDAASPEARERRFSGCATGFRDTSRIASSNPVMWREIIEHNQSAVLVAMRDFDRCYERFRELIERGDFDAFEREFAEGKRLRDEWVAYKQMTALKQETKPVHTGMDNKGDETENGD